MWERGELHLHVVESNKKNRVALSGTGKRGKGNFSFTAPENSVGRNNFTRR